MTHPLEAPYRSRMHAAAMAGDYAALERARAELEAAMLAHFRPSQTDEITTEAQPEMENA